MPLSDNEQKLLEQMERALYAEDPRFATQMRGSAGGKPSRSRVAAGVVAALIGLGLVIAGVSTSIIALGVVGFIVMVAGVAWGFTSTGSKKATAATGPAAMPHRGRKPSGSPRPSGGAGSFNDKLEERWERRRRENGGM